MELTRKDRLVLMNQYNILKHLDTDNAEHYEELATILFEGYEYYYGELDEYMGDDMPLAESQLVIDILSIYRAIENYKLENADDEVNNHPYSHFLGFDANNEMSYLSFLRFILEKKNIFTEQLQYRSQTDYFNSHAPMVQRYQAMISVWSRVGEKFALTKNEILQILNT